MPAIPVRIRAFLNSGVPLNTETDTIYIGAVENSDATIVGQLGSLELQEPGAKAAAVYDQPIALRVLFKDQPSGAEHHLVRYPTGLRGRIHRHTAAHTIVVLEGWLDANGQVIGPGSYAHFPAGEPMRHQATEKGPRLFVLLFHGPFDVEPVTD